MQQWSEQGAADGFNVMFSHFPGGVSEFVSQVIPALQRRGLLREHYTASTLRGNLGL